MLRSWLKLLTTFANVVSEEPGGARPARCHACRLVPAGCGRRPKAGLLARGFGRDFATFRAPHPLRIGGSPPTVAGTAPAFVRLPFSPTLASAAPLGTSGLGAGPKACQFRP